MILEVSPQRQQEFLGDTLGSRLGPFEELTLSTGEYSAEFPYMILARVSLFLFLVVCFAQRGEVAGHSFALKCGQFLRVFLNDSGGSERRRTYESACLL